jgi:outer membrane protein, heavy metal efflux system
MKNYLFYIFFFFIVGIFPSSVISQPLDSLVSEGLRNNPGIRGLEKNISAADLKGQSAGYLPPPSIGVEFSQVPFDDPDPLKNSLSQNLIISQMFMTGGKLSAMENAERKQSEILTTDLHSYKLKLSEEIKKVYYDIWMMEHHIALREDNLKFLESIYQSTEQFYKVNRTPYSDLLLVKADIAANRSEIEVMSNELKSMYIMMNSLLGRDDMNTEIIVRHNWVPDTSASVLGNYEKALLTSNPSLVKMDKMEEMARLEITANNKELYPDLMIQGMIMRMPRGMILTTQTPLHSLSEPGMTEYMFSVMASVTLPFAPWSSGRIKAKEEQLLASIEGIGAEKRNMELMLNSQLHSLLNTARSARREMELMNSDVIPLYKQALQSQVSEFQNNRNTISNLIQTINMLIMKEEELAEAVTRYQKVLAEIESLTAAGYNSEIQRKLK